MKKISVVLIFIMMCTSITFAESRPKKETIKSLNELSQIDNDLHVIIDNIISNKFDINKEKDSLAFVRSRLGEVISINYTYYNSKDLDLLNNRESAVMIYIASLYGLTVNGLLLYLEDTDHNDAFLIDAIAEYKSGNTALSTANGYVNKSK